MLLGSTTSTSCIFHNCQSEKKKMVLSSRKGTFVISIQPLQLASWLVQTNTLKEYRERPKVAYTQDSKDTIWWRSSAHLLVKRSRLFGASASNTTWRRREPRGKRITKVTTTRSLKLQKGLCMRRIYNIFYYIWASKTPWKMDTDA